MRGEDGDRVPERLQAHGRVDDEALGAADAQVWVQEDDVLARHTGRSYLEVEHTGSRLENGLSGTRPEFAEIRCFYGMRLHSGRGYTMRWYGWPTHIRMPDQSC